MVNILCFQCGAGLRIWSMVGEKNPTSCLVWQRKKEQLSQLNWWHIHSGFTWSGTSGSKGCMFSKLLINIDSIGTFFTLARNTYTIPHSLKPVCLCGFVVAVVCHNNAMISQLPPSRHPPTLMCHMYKLKQSTLKTFLYMYVYPQVIYSIALGGHFLNFM